jgi:hypothetical protein
VLERGKNKGRFPENQWFLTINLKSLGIHHIDQRVSRYFLKDGIDNELLIDS